MDLSTDLAALGQTDQDALIRMTAAEAGDQPPAAQQAVASTALNRANLTGESVAKIASDPSVYNGVATPRFDVSPNSAAYQAVAANLQPVIQNGPTTSATHFYAPNLVSAPEWANGPGQKIGSQLFFSRPQDFQPSAQSQANDQTDFANYLAGRGVRTVTPAPGGGVTDPATGEKYTPDPAHPGQYLNAANQSYEIDDPAQDLADFQKLRSSQPAAPPSAPATFGGIVGQLGRGFAQAGAGIANLVYGAVPGAREALDMEAPLVARFMPQTAHALAGFGNWTQQAPQNVPEQIANTVGQFLPGAALGPEGDVGAAGQLLSRVGVNVLSPTAGSLVGRYGSAAMGATPEQQGIAADLGGLGGGIAGVAALNPSGIASMASRTARPFMANFGPIAERQAGQSLANAATDYPAAASALAGYKPLVPGSPATLGDVTGDLGLIGASRKAATVNPTAYNEMVGQQAAARNAELAALTPGGDPMAAQSAVAGHLAGLDQGNADIANEATARSQAAVAAFGGAGTPEGYGSALRGSLEASRGAAQEGVNAAWEPVDKTAMVDTSSIAPAAKAVTDGMTDFAHPSDVEKVPFADAARMGAQSSLQQLLDLRGTVGDALAASRDIHGNATASTRRLAQLFGSVNETLNNFGQSVGRDTEGVYDRLATVGTAADQAASVTEVGAPSSGHPPETGAVSLGANGTALPANGGPGGAAGNQGVQGEISSSLTPIASGKQIVGYTAPDGSTMSVAAARSWTPPANAASANPALSATYNADQAAAWENANAATRGFHETFTDGTVGQAMARDQYGNAKLADGSLPGKFFKPGPTGFEAMGDLQSASPDAYHAIGDYAASTLRKAALNPDGTLDPTKFAAWQKQYGDALRALPPEQQAAFADAGKAAQAVADATVARTTALKANNTRALSLVMNAQTPEEVTARIGSLLTGATRVSDMDQLLGAIGGNTAARTGLKQAALDYVSNRFIGNTEAAASGENKISADKFQTFLSTAQPALSRILQPDELQRLNAIGADIQQSQRTMGATRLAGQSNSAQDFAAGGILSHGATPSILSAIIGGAVGHVAGAFSHIPFSQEAGEAAGLWAQALRSHGIANVQALINRAVLDPEVAKNLLAKVKGPVSPSSGAGLALMRALAGPSLVAASPSTTPNALQGQQP